MGRRPPQLSYAPGGFSDLTCCGSGYIIHNMKLLPLVNSSAACWVDDDFNVPGKFRLTEKGYVVHCSTRRLLHRIVLDVTDNSILVDHANRNRLNNTRANLRPATHSQNNTNRAASSRSKSGLKNVHYDSRKGTYRVVVNAEQRAHFLGVFNEDELEIATTVADLGIIKLHGNYGSTNRPREVYELEAEYSFDKHYPELTIPVYVIHTLEGEVINRNNLSDYAKEIGVDFRTLQYILAGNEKKGRRLYKNGMRIYYASALVTPRMHVDRMLSKRA